MARLRPILLAAAQPAANGESSSADHAKQGALGGPTEGAVLPEADGVGWRLAPMIWGGDISYEARLTRYNEQQAGTWEQFGIANLRARSYVWEPWFVQLRGGLSLVLSRLEAEGDAAAGAASSVSDPTTVTGNFGVTVFPVSRFPFDASIEVIDSRASGQLTLVDYLNTRYGVRQSYTTLDGVTYMAARYERSVLESDAFGTDTLDNLEANLSRAAGSHSLRLDATYAHNERELTETSATTESVTVTDTYRPNPLLSVESLAYVNRLEFDPGNDSSLGSIGTRTAQATSFATWRPSMRSPWYVTGSLRWLDLENESDTAGVGAGVRTLNATLGATYQYRPSTRFYGNLSVVDSRSDSAHALATAETVGASYTPVPIPLGKIDYSWSASGSLSNATLSGQESRQAVGGSLGQNFTRNFVTGPGAAASVTFAQSLGSAYDTESRHLSTLGNSLGVSWSRTAEIGAADFASLTISDSRTVGAAEAVFQLVNLQFTHQGQLDRMSSWSGNATIQASRQHTQTTGAPGALVPATDIETSALSYSVNLTYQHQRAFNVRNLFFYALLSANSQQLEARTAGDINAAPEFIDNSLELRFDYLIGRVLARLAAGTAEIGGVRQSQVLFRVTRYFGSL